MLSLLNLLPHFFGLGGDTHLDVQRQATSCHYAFCFCPSQADHQSPILLAKKELDAKHTVTLHSHRGDTTFSYRQMYLAERYAFVFVPA